MFIVLTGALYIAANSALKQHILKDLVPRGFDVRIKEIQEEHKLAIQERDNQMQATQYHNVGLQGKIREKDQHNERSKSTITHLRERYVYHARDPDKDNITIILK